MLAWVQAAGLAQVTGAVQPLAEATREVQWNVTTPMAVLMYGSMVVALAVCAHGTWRRARIWRIGRGGPRWDQPWTRARHTLRETFGHTRLLEDALPGLIHWLVFFGFVVLFVATVIVMVHHDLGIPIMRGRFYLWYQSLAVNAFGVLAIAGVVAAAYRRAVVRPSRLAPQRTGDAVVLGALFLILLTGFLISGLRIAATGDPWGAWRPVGYLVARASLAVLPESALAPLHAWTWSAHVVMWHALLAAFPYSKMFHLISGPLSVFAATPPQGTAAKDARVPAAGATATAALAPFSRALGTPPVIDFDRPEGPGTLGIRSPFDLTWKQLLELDACTECGRCQDACPAWAVGKPLSPKRVIMDVRDHVRANAGALERADRARRSGDAAAVDALVAELPMLGGGVIRPETLWACTTCRACEEACPVSIEHVSLIVGMRQHLVMEQGEAPEGVADMVRSLEVREHPFRGAGGERAAWLRTVSSPGARGAS